MLSVIYENNGKTAIFNGARYHLEKETGYYLHTGSKGNKNSRLHRDVYEYYNGEIPKGFHVHHKDHDKSNNDISNLVMLTKKEHNKIHSKEMTEEEKMWRRNNLINNAVPKAREYNLKNRSKEYYQKQYEKSKDKLHEIKEFICIECGKVFTTVNNGSNKFCGNNCKSKHRRNSGVDNEERSCPVCENAFSTNKYSKTVCCSRSCANTYRSKNK